VRSFQAAEGLTVDGVYGPGTKSKLVAAAATGTRVCASNTTTTNSAVTTTTTASGASATALASINAYERTNGPAAGTWQITSTQVSSVDPSYVLFRIGPTAGHQDTVQGGYGFVHNQSGTWTVIGFGSAQVGCPPGSAQAPVVPTAVLTGFGLACPPSN
jgi:peptidoglycan hydrolase-like protein with peptidoglycan-binding domain